MLAAAARGVASLVDATRPGAPILPQVETMRTVSAVVAEKVVRAAVEEGLASKPPSDVEGCVRQAMWNPVYRPIRAV
jgi:malate dehydrogenase (oxaloacetate-decarboxylating)